MKKFIMDEEVGPAIFFVVSLILSGIMFFVMGDSVAAEDIPRCYGPLVCD